MKSRQRCSSLSTSLMLFASDSRALSCSTSARRSALRSAFSMLLMTSAPSDSTRLPFLLSSQAMNGANLAPTLCQSASVMASFLAKSASKTTLFKVLKAACQAGLIASIFSVSVPLVLIFDSGYSAISLPHSVRFLLLIASNWLGATFSCSSALLSKADSLQRRK